MNSLFLLLLCIISLANVLPLQTSSTLRLVKCRQSLLCSKSQNSYASNSMDFAPAKTSTISNNVLTPYFAATVSGLAASVMVMLSRQYIALIDKSFLSKYPLYTPILAGGLIGGLNLLEEKVSQPSFAKLSLQDKPIVSWKKFLLRWIGFVISIGAGLSVGIAGPAAEIGMVATYFLCQLFSAVLPVSELIPLLLAGAGAGLAANFNAPISGALYSLEITNQLISQEDQSSIPHDKRKRYLLLAIIAAVLYVRKQSIFVVSVPLLKVNKELGNNIFVDCISIMTLGLSSGMVFHLYTILRSFFQKRYSSLPLVVRPIIAGTFCGIAALVGFPQTLSNGFSTINSINSGLYSFRKLLLFLAFKLCLVASSSVANIPGGQLAPLLFVGASAGALWHQILYASLFQGMGITYSVATFSLVGAAALLSANFKSPLFAAVLIFELTKSWDLTIASAIAAIISERFTKWLANKKV